MNKNRMLMTLTLIGAAVSFLVGFSHSEPDIRRKATWVWQPESIENGKETILSFAEQQGINLLYVKVDTTKPYSFYRPFIHAANAAGIEVHALGGHPAWALASHRERMMKLVNWVHGYNQSAAANERLHGVHLDIEPYVLPQWETDQETVLREWTANIAAFVTEAKQDPELETSADLAFWLDQIPSPVQADVSVSQWMIQRLDHVTVMAYRDQVAGLNGMAALSQDELTCADEWGKSVIVAVNMKEMPTERHTSFYEEGPAQMQRQVDLLAEQLRTHPSFTGVAVHDYRYWMQSTESAPEPASFLTGTYVWHADMAISQQEEIIAHAKEHKLNLLYVRLDLEQPYDAYRDFVRQATAAGIEVHAMGGHPVWALEENRHRIHRLVNWVKAYNSRAAKEEQFRGIHLDIEPYVLPDWSERREQVIEQWIGNVRSFVTETKRESDLEASADLAIWLDKIMVPGQPDRSVSEWMIRELDHVALMAFRDKAEGPGGIMHVIRDELAWADALNKKLIVSVEMKESAEGEFITFHEEGKTEMNQQLQLLRSKVTNPSFRGVAVHAYEYWRTAAD